MGQWVLDALHWHWISEEGPATIRTARAVSLRYTHRIMIELKKTIKTTKPPTTQRAVWAKATSFGPRLDLELEGKETKNHHIATYFFS